MAHTTYRALLLLAAVAALAAPAAADDPPAEKSGEAAAADATPPIGSSPGGDRVRVRVRGGRTLDGVVRAKSTWETRDFRGSWVPAKRDDKGAGIRLWWVSDLDGYLFVAASRIEELRSLGPVAEDPAELATRRRQASERAEAERTKLDEQRTQEDDVAAQARSLLEEVDKAKREAAALDLVEQQKKDDAAKAKRWAELLARFPPDKWSPDTLKEIERRKTTLHVFPSDDEIEFLGVFDEWKAAYAAWKAAQDAAAKSAGAGGRSAAARPSK